MHSAITKEELKQYQQLNAKVEEQKEILNAIKIFEAVSEADCRTDYDHRQMIRYTNYNREKWSASNETEKEKIRNEKEPWGVIYIRRENSHMSLSIIEEISQGFIQCYQDGNRGVWNDNRFWVALVPVQTRNDLTEVVEKLREYCPNTKVKLTEQITSIF